MGENAIWEVAGFYNETIMQAAIVQKTLRNWSIFVLFQIIITGVSISPKWNLIKNRATKSCEL